MLCVFYTVNIKCRKIKESTFESLKCVLIISIVESNWKKGIWETNILCVNIEIPSCSCSRQSYGYCIVILGRERILSTITCRKTSTTTLLDSNNQINFQKYLQRLASKNLDLLVHDSHSTNNRNSTIFTHTSRFRFILYLTWSLLSCFSHKRRLYISKINSNSIKNKNGEYTAQNVVLSCFKYIFLIIILKNNIDKDIIYYNVVHNYEIIYIS